MHLLRSPRDENISAKSGLQGKCLITVQENVVKAGIFMLEKNNAFWIPLTRHTLVTWMFDIAFLFLTESTKANCPLGMCEFAPINSLLRWHMSVLFVVAECYDCARACSSVSPLSELLNPFINNSIGSFWLHSRQEYYNIVLCAVTMKLHICMQKKLMLELVSFQYSLSFVGNAKQLWGVTLVDYRNTRRTSASIFDAISLRNSSCRKAGVDWRDAKLWLVDKIMMSQPHDLTRKFQRTHSAGVKLDVTLEENLLEHDT